MKKVLTLTLIFVCSLSLLVACKKNTLPVPEYPLTAEDIEKEIEIWGKEWFLEEEKISDWGVDKDGNIKKREGMRNMYTFYSTENGKTPGAILSGMLDGERVLTVSFLPYTTAHNTIPIPLEESKGAIVFATRLFGGFKDENQVYDAFIKDYDRKNITEKLRKSKYQPDSLEFCWMKKVNGITCRICLLQPSLEDPQVYMLDMGFARDWDRFFPNFKIEEYNIEKRKTHGDL